jgi:nitrite reductase/ring-hydroxylating ferredoxin subunit/multimeric flavodoxin WrbA
MAEPPSSAPLEMPEPTGGPGWYDLGPVEALADRPVREVRIGRVRLALTYRNGTFGAISGVCNHVGGPLGQGNLEGDYLVCPWHYWRFERTTGAGEPGYEADRVPSYRVEVRDGHVWVDLVQATKRGRLPHPPHPLAREPVREPGPPRVVGISTTVMDTTHPRYSTSEALLEVGLEHAAALGHGTRLLRLRDLAFRSCEGFYSKSARACTWPCSITQMDKRDQLEAVYEAVVHWADVILLASPIRWGAASSLYYKMVERMNCIQNQITIRNKVLMRDKVASFVITGGQDGVQAVAGQMLGFFAEIGCTFPPFPYVAHTRGWSAEDMEHNVEFVKMSEELRDGTRELVDRALETSRRLLAAPVGGERMARGGRKAHAMADEMPMQPAEPPAEPIPALEGTST